MEAQGAMEADEATTCDPPLSSAAPPRPHPPADPPPPSPPPPPAASSKRRWSPCTWRYAIEDAQAELPSRPPRGTAPLGGTALPPHSSRTPHSSSQQQQSAKLSKPSCYNPLYSKAGEDPQRISSSRLHVEVELQPPRAQSSASQPPLQVKRRTREMYRKSHHHLHSSSKARPCEDHDEAEEGGDTGEDADNYDDDHHAELAVYDEEYFKRRRREMSPSELYFCTMCSTKAAETKGRTEPIAYDSS